jgi:hypothetical protein
MITLAKTSQKTKATPGDVFALWADIDNWTDFDDGIEWAKLTDTFAAGGHYVIKPKGGPKTEATIQIIESNKRFVDISHLPGASLTFDHVLTQGQSGVTVEITMALSGPFAWLWAKIRGKNQQADLDKSTAALIKKAEAKR